ncbi:MAG: Coenzyme F420 hydrogenase/dehydrogenase, beta subunit C-terminal domain [Bacteroidales bacterium]|nr:Coenzyme F420 hydrogenase/dehydrogenase, beta subunit C-terminal domain [Bacteroidales bacterium]
MKPLLPSSDQCCGCASCVDACPQKALSVVEDENSFLAVHVDENKCIGCHLCERQCHLLHPERLQRHDARKVQPYAGWSIRPELIEKSASGGIFAQLAYDFLNPEHGEPHYVYGAALQPDGNVRHIEISTRQELPLLQNSKYQQSDLQGVYSQVKKRLKQGAYVLFSGVPCQIAALYSFLGQDKALSDRLYTVEVLCHGVPTQALYRTALQVEQAKRIVSYRTKDECGWINNNNRLTYEMPDGRLQTKKKHVYDFLFRAYLEFSFTRKNCFQCPYANISRVSDVTLADFWGWNQSRKKESYRNHMGTSVITPNSEKGAALLKSSRELHLVETSWEEFLPQNQNFFMPTNHYLFAGADKIKRIQQLPLGCQKFIFQNGFSNRYLNEAYKRVLSVLLFFKHRREEAEVKRQLKATLAYLKKL